MLLIGVFLAALTKHHAIFPSLSFNPSVRNFQRHDVDHPSHQDVQLRGEDDEDGEGNTQMITNPYSAGINLDVRAN